MFVQEAVYDEFVAKTVAAAQQSVMGDPLDANTTQGPQVSKTQQERILGYISKGKNEGARLMTGG